MKILFFDLETTGLSPAKNGIHKMSGEIIINGETKELFEFKVQPNPKCIIEEEALKVAGVTKEQILNYAPMGEVYRQLVKMLSKYVDKYDKTDKFFLACFNNASFDNDFFRGFFLQNGDQYFGSWFWSNSFDIMVLSTPVLAEKRHLMPNFKLATVAEWMGVVVDQEKLHDAGYDIWLTKQIFNAITK